MRASADPRIRKEGGLSNLTRAKISASLMGRTDTQETRNKKSKSQMGSQNFFFGKGPGQKALDLAAAKNGIKVYVYDAVSLNLVNNKPFRSIRSAAGSLPISPNTLLIKLDTGKPFKGYYYFSKP